MFEMNGELQTPQRILAGCKFAVDNFPVTVELTVVKPVGDKFGGARR
jgi:hypothetical protein